MNLVLCDDHQLFTEALAVVLEDHGHTVIACASTPEEAVEVIRAQAVDVCLIDLHFPGGTGLGAIVAIADITASRPGTRIVVLSASDEPGLVRSAVEAGAAGVTFKGESVASILFAIDQVSNGGTILKGSAVRALTEVPRPPVTTPIQELARYLTGREREVLLRLVHGEGSAELAVHMGVRYSTVRTHVQNILTKLGAHSKLELVAMAMAEGLVEFDSAAHRSSAG